MFSKLYYTDDKGQIDFAYSISFVAAMQSSNSVLLFLCISTSYMDCTGTLHLKILKTLSKDKGK